MYEPVGSSQAVFSVFIEVSQFEDVLTLSMMLQNETWSGYTLQRSNEEE